MGEGPVRPRRGPAGPPGGGPGGLGQPAAGGRGAPEAPADQVAEQLARINEQLAIKNRRAKRIWQCVAGVLIGLVVLTLVLVLLNAVAFGSYDTEVQSQTQTMSLLPNLTEREGSL